MHGLLSLIFLSLTAALYSQAGWIITEQTGETTDGKGLESTLYFKDNKIRSAEINQTLIIDLNAWQLTFLYPENQGYWSGTPLEYISSFNEYALKFLEQEIQRADNDDRPYLEAIYEDLKMDIQSAGSDIISFIGELPVEVIMTNESGRILGYPVNRFLIYVDGILVEELWLTREISLKGVYDYHKFRKFTDEMSWGRIFQDYRSSEQYIHLLGQGLPLKTIEWPGNGKSLVTTVISIQKAEIPDSLFRIPPDFKPVSLPEPDAGLF
jgi:hypothetical protein